MATPSASLPQLVKDQCHNLDLHFKAEEPLEALTQKEQQAIEKTTFPEDLKLAVPVDLESSKKAFLAIVSGLSGDMPSFKDLWQIKPHNPRADYNPMQAVDLEFDFEFLSSSSQQGSPQGSEEN